MRRARLRRLVEGLVDAWIDHEKMADVALRVLVEGPQTVRIDDFILAEPRDIVVFERGDPDYEADLLAMLERDRVDDGRPPSPTPLRPPVVTAITRDVGGIRFALEKAWLDECDAELLSRQRDFELTRFFFPKEKPDE